MGAPSALALVNSLKHPVGLEKKGSAVPAKREKSLTNFVGLRLSETEKSGLSVLAQSEGISESEVMRRLLKAAIGLPLPVAESSKMELRSCAEQLRKAGLNLNQGVRAMNEGRVAYSEAMLGALQKLSGAVIELQMTLKEMHSQSRRQRKMND